MSKIKNIILKAILITMLTAVAILSAQTRVEAIRLPFGQTSVIAGGRGQATGAQCIDGEPGNNTFCVVNGRALSTERYNVANYISIDGQTAKVYNGNTNDESAKIGEYVRPENAAMAWILAQEDTGSWPYSSIYSAKQKAVYTYFPTWKMVVGLGNFATNVYSQNTNYDWVRKAQEYAGNVSPEGKSTDTATIEDRTEKVKDRLPVEINGTAMINVGPFKVEYKGDIETFVVKDQNDAPIESALIGKYEGTELKTSSKASEIIKSGEEFYVLVPGDGSVTAINGIDIGVYYEQHIVSAEIWTLQRQASWKQNLITVDASEKTEPTRDSVTIPGKPVVDTPTPLTPAPTPTPSVGTPTPSIETPTPPIETPTPSIETPTPPIETPTPSIETPTPPIETPTPSIETPTPPVETPTPPNETPTPGPGPGPEVPTTTRLQVVKVNQDAKEFRISGVGFVIQLESTGKYLKRLEHPTETTNFEFVDNREDATVFVTDDNGEINEDGVLVGKYIAYEVSNTHYGYEVKPEGTKIEVREDDNVIQTNIIENKQRWVKLSGYVWEDIAVNKAGERDDLFQDNSYDDGDKLMPGIRVRLKDITTGETVQETLTDENGAYLFEDVEIDKLEDYYIEFEYNGLVYTNVIKHIDLDNGSKAEEGEDVRKEFNERFNSVEGDNPTENTGVTKGKDGNVTYNLKYTRGEGEDVNKSFLDYTNLETPITANTENAGYDIYSHFSYGYVEEVKYINLGLYKREQPDIALIKDVQNAIVGINGYNHTYNYRLKPTEEYTKYTEGFNIGVRFQSELSQTYKRPIYKSDATFIDENQNKDNELDVAVTYKISFVNQSTTLGARINGILDYYDAKYGKVYKVGSQIDEKGMITDDSVLQYEDGTYNEKYNLVKIATPDTIIEPGKASKQKNETTGEVEEIPEEYNTMEIYVQFLMDRETVQRILVMNENEEDPQGPLENVAEVSSYTSFDKDGNVYAGIDKDSAPANATPDDVNTYEDDTDIAPGFILQYAGGNRYTTGNVFEDLPEGTEFADDATAPGKSRLGDGKYNAATEPGIAGIGVRLVEAEVDENGTPTGKPKLDSSGNPILAKDYSQNSEKTDPIDPNDYREITAMSVAGTGEDAGTYKLEGFVPGKYLIQFIWGGKTYYADLENRKTAESLSDEDVEKAMKYSAEDFKGTTQPKDEWERKMNNLQWYKEYKEDLTQDPRYTDAQDSQEIRQQIDNRLIHQVYENTNRTDKTQLIDMVSTSAPMDITVEFTDLNVTETEINEGTTKDVMLAYEVPHVDFGIIERARQDLELGKRVSRIKLILKNNQPLVDATIDESGNVEGVQDSFVYLAPTGKSDNGKLKIEIDKEIAQRSTLEVEYKFKVENKSELDYEDVEFYNYGTPSSSAKVRTLSAEQVIDYLDSDWGYERESQTNLNNGWTPVEADTLINNHTFTDPVTSETFEMFSQEVKDSNGVKKVSILESDILKQDLEPLQTKEASLVVSKILDPDGDIELSNEAEVTHVYKAHGGRDVISTPGNYIPALSLQEIFDENTGDVKLASNVESDSTMAETTTITPPTGGNGITYIMIIGTVILSLTILATGIVIIKKKVLTK